jgi:hypothetical protein
MAKRIGVAIVAAAWMVAGFVAITSAAAAPSQSRAQKQQPDEASDLGAHRSSRHHQRHVYRPIDRRYYYDRPSYYAPAPFFPFLGLGYGPWW